MSYFSDNERSMFEYKSTYVLTISRYYDYIKNDLSNKIVTYFGI